MLGALRVSRVPPTWTPASLGDLVSWHDASDAATITSSGGKVSQWNDKSGGGYHFTQGTNAERPVTASATINSLNAVDCTGASHHHMSTSSFGSTKRPCTLYVVFKADLTSTAMTIVGGAEGSSASSMKLVVVNSGGYKWAFADAGGTGPVGAVVDTSAHVFCLVNRRVGDWSSSNTIYVDSAATGTTASMFGGGLGELRLAGGYWGGGDGAFGEIVATSTEHSETTRSTVMTYLGAKWGVTIS